MKKIACIVLPMYNEVENIKVLIPLLFEQSARISSHELHVLVVDDKSPDGTATLVKNLHKNFDNLHLLVGDKKGLGDAYTRGIKFALENIAPDIVIQMDADLQHDPKLIPLFIELTEFGFSMVIGSRFASGGEIINFALHRRFLSVFGNILIRFFGGLPRIRDCTSGYRCIKANLLRQCRMSGLSTRGYAYQSSLLCELLRNGARVVEIPITFSRRKHGSSKLSLRDQIDFLGNIVRIRFRQSSEFLKNCFIGFTGILVNMSIYLLVTRYLGLKIWIASPIAIECSIISNFLLFNLLTRSNSKNGSAWLRKFQEYQVLSGISGIINFVLLIYLTFQINLWDIGANLIGIICATTVGYFVHATWSWRKIRVV